MEDELRDRLRYPSLDRYRVRLGELEEIDAETVTVIVRATWIREPGLFEFPDDRNHHDYEFELRRSTDGFWLIAESEWPIELAYIRNDYCEDQPA